MRVLLAFSLCLFIGASSVQAEGWKSLWRLSSLSSKALSVAERRIIVRNYSANIGRISAANRLNFTAAQIPMFERSLQTYYKLVANHLPAVAAKPMSAAVNPLEEMALSMPVSLAAEPFFSHNISERAMEVYLAAQMADAWGSWLENAAGENPTFDAEASSSEIKAASRLYRELSSNFKKLYSDLPAEDRDLSAQLSRVLANVAQTTGWSEEIMGSLDIYFKQVMNTVIGKQDNLTMTEFLQAYDVLAVASELGGRYLNRMEAGSSSLPHFLLMESVQRVKNSLVYGVVPANNSARVQRLTLWYEALVSPSRVVSQSAN